MTCHNCKVESTTFGRVRNGQQRYRCCQCRKTNPDPGNEHLGGMCTAPQKVEPVVTLLAERCSVRSIQRITGVHRNTIMKILALAGDRCPSLLENKCHAAPVTDVQCDEIWGSCGVRKNITGAEIPSLGVPIVLWLSSGQAGWF